MSDRQKTRHRGIYTRGEGRQKRYIVWFTDSNGKGHTETLPLGSNEQDALNRQAELRGMKATGQRVVRSKLRLGEFAEDWLVEQGRKLLSGDLAENTIQSYRASLKRLKPLHRMKMHEIGRPELASYVRQARASGYKAWTIRRDISTLSVILEDAIVAGHLARNPTKDLTRRDRPRGDQRKMRVLDRGEIETLLEVVPAYWKALVTTLVFTGMRISEALAVTWEDVDFVDFLVTVRRSKTEAGTDREIVVMPALADVIRSHHVSEVVRGYGRPDDFVFASKVGTQIDRCNALRGGVQAPAVKEALGHLTQHELRHTFASLLIGQGLDVTFVADQLGHADPAITLRTYAKLFDPSARRDEARERLQAAFGEMVA